VGREGGRPGTEMGGREGKESEEEVEGIERGRER